MTQAAFTQQLKDKVAIYPCTTRITCCTLATSMTALRLDSNTEERLNLLAKQTGRTKSFYMRKAITEALEDMEDYYLGMLALENTRKIYSKEEAKRELGL